jgi:hypothetical protein
MTTITMSRTTYASGAEVEVSKKMLSTGEFIQLKFRYESLPEESKWESEDAIIFTMKPEHARELAEVILKL